MRCNKNITLELKNITSHFTGKEKIMTLISIIIMLSFVNIINTSALSYSNSVDIGFTFNPTLSLNISSSDLIIPNLTPGTTDTSNEISVNISTNSAYGYTLSAIVNGNNSNLTHSNGTNIFSSIDTNADLSSLDNSEDTNIWGYSYKDNTVAYPTWSNYNGLSNGNSTALINTNSNVSSNLDFKIAAKAARTQPSGTYTGTINFIAVSKVAPMSLLDSFIASGTEQLNGYYKMQDMTHDICESVDVEESELQLIDVRDNKVYWVAKLKDGNCWMTQNLDLDLSHEVALTSETSDIDPTSYGTTIYTEETGYTKDETTGVVSWLPSTIDENGVQRADTIDMVWNSDASATVPGWANNNYSPYSANAGNRYLYTDNSGNETTYTSLDACVADNNNSRSGCEHTHLSNYYNWSAAVASNNTNGASGSQANSICPKGWDLPLSGAYGVLMQAQHIWSGRNTNYDTDGFNKIRTSPVYYQRFGIIDGGSLIYLGASGYYWSSTTNLDDATSYYLSFNSSNIWPNVKNRKRLFGFSARCIAE